jgi:hypothetical protein
LKMTLTGSRALLTSGRPDVADIGVAKYILLNLSR